MKSRRKKRLLAMVLCVVMILSLSISVMAEGGATASDGTESEAMLLSDGAESSETITEPTPEPTAEPTPEVTQTPEATPEVTPEPVTTTPTPTPETVQEDSETVQTDVTTDESQTSDVQNVETQSVTPDSEPVQAVQPYESSYEDNDVVIRVSAEAGIVPEGAVLSVTPIVKRDVTDDMTDEEKAQVEAVNAQYDLTEKKLTEDSEAKEETMEGFLAYDISFLVDGVEVEPSGDVNVTMEFKQAALPEGVSEDAEVSVKHLKEEAAAVDGVVVEDMAEKASVQTTDAAAVEKVELTANSFSTFTIIWGNWNSGRMVTVHYVDANGNEIDGEQEQSIRVESGVSVELSQYAEAEGYTYQGAHLNSYNGQEIYSIKYSNRSDTWSYKTVANGTDNEWYYGYNGRHVYLVFSADELTTVATVDNATGGITMRMIDYSSPANGLNIGGSYGNGNVKQGLLKNELAGNGYPVTVGNVNLRSLFSGGQTVNNLFLQSTYDETGYYEYSSFENYAYLNSNGSFTVYEQIGTPSDHKNDGAYYYNRGNFLPYNQLDLSVESGNRNLYNEEGQALDQSNPRYGEELYTSRNSTNYYFGMYMEVNFSQPEDGYAVHNGTSSPMIYEFNGDDDLWIYIDDVLVLDIGGIHDAHSGYINFATGEVHVECINNRGGNQDTTIKQMYKDAGVFPDGSTWDDSRVDEYFEGDTFRDYTTHTMKMFYMERGAGASNLHMRFNLQTVPEGTIEVTKDLTNTDKEKYANVEFAFQVLAQEITGEDSQGNETYSDNYVTLGKAVYKGSNPEQSIEFHNGVEIGGETYDNVFYLKPGETAQFSGLQKDRKYYVREIGVNTSEYYEVIINGTVILQEDEDGSVSEITNIQSPEEAVGKRPSVTFQNSCSLLNRRELQITKTMAEGQSTTDTFTFQVWLENTAGDLELYNGPYYMTQTIDNETVYYHYDDEGNLVPYEGNEASLVCGNAENGVISGVRAGYTVAITQILSGTSFKVAEVNPGEKYLEPGKELVAGTYTTEGCVDGADGEILLGEDAEVIITNTLKQQIQVTKQWITISDIAEPDIYVGLYNQGMPVADQYRVLNADNSWTAVFEGVGTGYSVKELRPVQDGEQAEFTINNQGYIGLEDGNTITADGRTFTVDYSGLTQDETISNQLNYTIRNVEKWQIVKRSSSDTNPVLANAEFELKSGDTTYKGTSGAEGVITWEDSDGNVYNDIFPDGTYTLSETKAPTGYLLGESWTITIENGLPTAVTGTQGEGDTSSAVSTDNGITFYKNNNILTLYYDNEVLYELPSAGGPGIHMYMVGGVLLMSAGVLMIYRNKRREVLRRK